MVTLALQYALFVFVAACGAIQVSAAHASLKGLLFVPVRPRMASLLGYLLMAAAFLWFFGLVDRNQRGLEGFEQALLFFPSAVCAVAVTIVVSSLVHQRRTRPPHGSRSRRRASETARGLEALRERSYLDVFLEKSEKAAR